MCVRACVFVHACVCVSVLLWVLYFVWIGCAEISWLCLHISFSWMKMDASFVLQWCANNNEFKNYEKQHESDMYVACNLTQHHSFLSRA